MANLVQQFIRQQASTAANNAGAAALAAQEQRVVGQAIFSGAGDAKTEIKLPVAFTEKPQFYSGCELTPQASLVEGDYPYANPLAADWQVSSQHLFVGFTLVVVIHGPLNTQIVVNWFVEGIGILNPILPRTATMG